MDEGRVRMLDEFKQLSNCEKLGIGEASGRIVDGMKDEVDASR